MTAGALRSVRVRVPATTSNLGPGFDCIGLALGLHNELTLELRPEPGPPRVEASGEGAGSLPPGRSNLMVEAVRRLIGRLPARSLVFKAVNRIPLARGLGSSAAAVVAALCAADRLLRVGASREELLDLAAGLEGHPDNAMAALRGGLVVAAPGASGPAVHALAPHPGLCAVVAIPDFELETSAARRVVPRRFSRRDAVANVGRALLLSSALERGLWERLGAAMEDSFHQPFRARLVPGLMDVIRAARRAGPFGAALSGAGPSVVALGPRGRGAAAIGRAMREAFGKAGVRSRALVLPVDREGVRVQKI